MKIKVRLSDAGLRDAERQIREYETTLNKKAQEFAKSLADKGLDVAKVRFANAEYAGSNDVSCRVEQNGNICTIIAEGKSVAFIEFGTGAHHKDMAANCRPVLVRMAPMVKARVLADVGTTTVTPVMPEPMWIPFPARDS